MTPSAIAEPRRYLEAQARWRAAETAFWLATLLPFAVFPSYLQLASQIAITALFALSLDLILGYAGIVSLGHAAFFGFASYAAGLVAKWGWGEPLSGLVVAAAAAGLLGYLASFVIARFRHLALIMITLGMGLLPPWRGQGIGRRLIETAIAAAWRQGFQRIELTVNEGNERALRLYRSVGFVVEGRFRQAVRFGEAYLDLIWMALLAKGMLAGKD